MLVSIIIPCFNVEKFIAECIDSALSQSYSDTEIICINNNSSDNTLNILLAYARRFPDKIRVFTQPKQGAPAARNLGISEAQGSWLQFLDADDIILPEKIAAQAKLAELAQPDISFIAAACIKRDLAGKDKKNDLFEQNMFLAPFINKSGNTCANLWKRQALLSAGAWNEELTSSQETELMLRLVIRGTRFLTDPVANTIIRQRESGQISQAEPEDRISRYISVRLNFIQEMEKNFPKEYKKISSAMHDFIVVSLIELAQYNSQKANDIFLTRVKKNWVSQYAFGLTPLKSLFIRIFGLSLYTKLTK